MGHLGVEARRLAEEYLSVLLQKRPFDEAQRFELEASCMLDPSVQDVRKLIARFDQGTL